MENITRAQENKTEIIVNLWFVHDIDGFIYSLRGRLYIGTGSDEEKLAFLQSLAHRDYLIAKPFPIPKRLWQYDRAVTHRSAVEPIYESSLFDEVYKALNDELPSQTPLDVPAKPLICITPLFGDDHFHISPYNTETDYFNKASH